jgi:hypothetical protein
MSKYGGQYVQLPVFCHGNTREFLSLPLECQDCVTNRSTITESYSYRLWKPERATR